MIQASVVRSESITALEQIASTAVKFRAKDKLSRVVRARQLSADREITTPEGVIKINKGDWLIALSKGRAKVMPREEFLTQFEPVRCRPNVPMLKYVKSMPIEAEIISEATEWHNPDAAPGSPPEIAAAGDFWAKPKGQAPYVIPGSYFRANYVQIPGAGEYARTTITTAQILKRRTSVWSPTAGVSTGAAGDYLITRPDNTQEMLSAQKFRDQFALAEAPAEQREPLNKPRAIGARFVLDPQRGVSAERWTHGFTLYQGNLITVIDERDASAKEYVDGRLVGEQTTVSTPVGIKLITRSYPYGDLHVVRALPTLDSYKDLLERRPQLAEAQRVADSMPMTHLIQTAERDALREEIRMTVRAEMERMRQGTAGGASGCWKLDQGRNLHIVLGLSGSGKSTIARQIARHIHSFIVDVDDVKPFFPEWQGGIGGAATSVEAHLVMNPIIADSLQRGDNLVLPVVGATTQHIEKLIQSARTNGYEVHISLVDVPATEAMKRIVGRLEQGGLYVDPTYLASLGNRPIQNFKALVQKYMDTGDIATYHQINNMGRTPVLVDEAHIIGSRDTSGLPEQFFARTNVRAESSEPTADAGSESTDTKEQAMSQVELTQITDPKSVFDGSEPKLTFVKPDLKPGEKKYYEITAEQVTEEYLATKGNKVVSKEQPDGQTVELTDWVLTRTGADGETQQWTMWDETNAQVATGAAFFQQRWKAVEGKDGHYSPRSVPTPMVELPEGGKLKVSWGEVQGGAGSFLAKYGEGDYNIITAKDLVETYGATDEASEKKLAEIKIALVEI